MNQLTARVCYVRYTRFLFLFNCDYLISSPIFSFDFLCHLRCVVAAEKMRWPIIAWCFSSRRRSISNPSKWRSMTKMMTPRPQTTNCTRTTITLRGPNWLAAPRKHAVVVVARTKHAKHSSASFFSPWFALDFSSAHNCSSPVTRTDQVMCFWFRIQSCISLTTKLTNTHTRFLFRRARD